MYTKDVLIESDKEVGVVVMYSNDRKNSEMIISEGKSITIPLSPACKIVKVNLTCIKVEEAKVKLSLTPGSSGLVAVSVATDTDKQYFRKILDGDVVPIEIDLKGVNIQASKRRLILDYDIEDYFYHGGQDGT